MRTLMKLSLLLTAMTYTVIDLARREDDEEDPYEIVQFSMSLSPSSADAIRRAAARAQMTISAYLSAAVGSARWNERFVDDVITLEDPDAPSIMRLPTPGFAVECACHRRCTPDNETEEIVKLTPKMTRRARDELHELARTTTGGPLSMQAYLEAASVVERWNHDHRSHQIILTKANGSYELLLPYAGLVTGDTVQVLSDTNRLPKPSARGVEP